MNKPPTATRLIENNGFLYWVTPQGQMHANEKYRPLLDVWQDENDFADLEPTPEQWARMVSNE